MSRNIANGNGRVPATFAQDMTPAEARIMQEHGSYGAIGLTWRTGASPLYLALSPIQKAHAAWASLKWKAKSTLVPSLEMTPRSNPVCPGRHRGNEAGVGRTKTKRTQPANESGPGASSIPSRKPCRVIRTSAALMRNQVEDLFVPEETNTRPGA